MPDNPNGPGSAATGAGQSSTGQTAPASGGAGSTAPGAPLTLTAREEALIRAASEAAIAPYRAEQANLRSLHDRQMNELRESVRSRSAAASGDGVSRGRMEASADPEPPISRSRLSSRQEQTVALIEFRQLHPDWADFWPEMEPIITDPVKAAPYAIVGTDPDTGEPYVDYRRSLEYIKTVLERDRLRKLKADFDQSRASGTATRDAARRDAMISGQGATGGEAVDWSKLSADEKVQKLYETAPELFDPNDLPSALRKK